MDYKAIHDQIIQRRLDNPLPADVYVERHHIKPKSLGGSNAKDNIVRLTAREHFIIHLLLVKIYPKGSSERRKMLYAAHRLKYGNPEVRNIGSRIYEYFKIEYSKVLSEQMKITMKGKKQTKEHRENNAAARRGVKFSEETKLKMSKAQTGRIITQEHRDNIRASKIGKPRSPETIEKMKEVSLL